MLSRTIDRVRRASDDLIRKVRARNSAVLYGLQRSGTNYVEQLLLQNTKSSDLKFANDKTDHGSYAHKHFRLNKDKTYRPTDEFLTPYDLSSPPFLDFIQEQDLVIIVFRHPQSWLASYRRFGEVCKWPKRSAEFDFLEYINFATAWQTLKFPNLHILRYEDVVIGNGAPIASLLRLIDVGSAALAKTHVEKVPVSDVFGREDAIRNVTPPKLDALAADSDERARLRELLESEIFGNLGYFADQTTF